MKAAQGEDQAIAALRKALADGSFALYCQPICTLKGPSGFTMAEALVRMRNEEDALLPPGDFLPVFEHFGMMPQLDRWVVRDVLGRLPRSRIPAYGINVSRQTLADGDFPAYVSAQAASARVPAHALLIEIDESDIEAAPEIARRAGDALKAAGCRIVVDGFSAKPGPLDSIRLLQPHFLKLDGSVTRRVLASESIARRVGAVVRIADAIGIEVIGACVEEQAVLARLKALGVGYAQGFGIYQPQPISSMEREGAGGAG